MILQYVMFKKILKDLKKSKSNDQSNNVRIRIFFFICEVLNLSFMLVNI